MVWGQKILVFSGPGRVLGGGERTGGDGHGWNPGPPKTPKSKKNTKHQSQRQKAKGKENTLTRQARKRGGGYKDYVTLQKLKRNCCVVVAEAELRSEASAAPEYAR